MTATESLQWIVSDAPAVDVPSGFTEPPEQPFSRLVRLIDDDLVRSGEARIEDAIAHFLVDVVADPDLLAGVPTPALSQRYARHLLHSGPTYSVVALVWRPGQMSSVHEHKSWCVFGIHRGALMESLFQLGKGGLRLTECRQHRPGAVTYSLPGSEAIHRIANLGVETAVSIHIYGVPFDRLGGDGNRVWAD